MPKLDGYSAIPLVESHELQRVRLQFDYIFS